MLRRSGWQESSALHMWLQIEELLLGAEEDVSPCQVTVSESLVQCYTISL